MWYKKSGSVYIGTIRRLYISYLCLKILIDSNMFLTFSCMFAGKFPRCLFQNGSDFSMQIAVSCYF